MNVLIVHTGGGGSYARKIGRSLLWISKHLHRKVKPWVVSVNGLANLLESDLTPESTIIHPRAAYPTETGWLYDLRKAQDAGYRVINSVETLKLTSNKLACATALQGKVNHPRTWVVNAGFDYSDLMEVLTLAASNNCFELVAKPIVSMEQGAQVIQFNSFEGVVEVVERIRAISGPSVIIQERVPYTALHRVIVIGGHALPYSFVDRVSSHPDSWKVSCCLNRTTMEFCNAPDTTLLSLAESVQDILGAQISFVDLFETAAGYTVSEVNTACNLSIHENLARRAKHPLWNIHYRIARYLSDVGQS